ncbi:hypothetical protein CXF83_03355 [Shewanella sp. Choline-02u-19]|uniref:hypothetical protein n=1 Tax=unclassified Shewanella TaxID=196818 RepID=UPI000C323770|nr:MULTISPECIES: hypothetical protein [unclassified Shewanella]PKH57181.1 hypothetical protein CXF84_09400 [Shewanella sp. Bg11-22]PKI29704.1 hypothetical protein CXF83_03355 [Shewanella sp. Choline-02u-19]
MPYSADNEAKSILISPAYSKAKNQELNKFAERYTRFALAIGQHDELYVDAYFGPRAWQEDAFWQPLTELRLQYEEGCQVLAAVGENHLDIELSGRYCFLEKQWLSIGAYLDLLEGKSLSFEEEARRLYDSAVVEYSLAELNSIHIELNNLLPGEGTFASRLAEFKLSYIVPKNKAAAVFNAAIDKARELTKKQFTLPAYEHCEIEYVNDKVWTAYNWYKGDYHSLIQLNQDQPLTIDRYLELATHEGYPGHHVFNALQEQLLVKEKGWLEYSIYPLFSPISYLAEGSANYALRLLMSQDEIVLFERDVLMPLAGLEADLTLFHKVFACIKRLGYFENHVSKLLTDKKINYKEATRLLVDDAFYTHSRAEQRTRFFDQNRSYIINYSVGEDAVAEWVESGTADKAIHWQRFEALLSRPRSASAMKVIR